MHSPVKESRERAAEKCKISKCSGGSELGSFSLPAPLGFI